MIFLVAIAGAVFGSFIAAYTYRYSKNISIAEGTSFCDNCKSPVRWYDNIPIISYLLLRGKCRDCRKRISPRYPIIEFSNMVIFITTYLYVTRCNSEWVKACEFLCFNNILTFILTTVLFSTLLAILVIDLESYIIPDELLVLVNFSVFAILIFANRDNFYEHIFSGFLASNIFLLLHLITRGKGMGLGDAKLAIGLGAFLGLRQMATWLLLSFVTGGIIGLILLMAGKKKMKSPVPFGPFLIFSFFAEFLVGVMISKFLI